jgi:arylsulfatase A-like enzyme
MLATRAHGGMLTRSAGAGAVCLLTVFLGVALATSCGRPTDRTARGPQASGAGTRPNIVLIMADDMGFSDLGSYGSGIATPNIDGLARQGVQFTQFYNAARCVPTRASLLTGLYPHQAGIGHMIGPSPNGLYDGALSRSAVTMAEALGAAGYATYMTGKWHLTPFRAGSQDMAVNGPTGRGFSRFYGIITSIRSYYNPPSLMEDGRELPPPEGDYHFTDAVTDHALEYIGTDRDPSQPYFLYVAYTAPHWPLHAREADIARYRGRFLDGWEALRAARHRRQVELKLIDPAWPMPARDPQEIPWADVKPEYRPWFDERMATYAAMIDQMDRGIGRILAAIEARGERERTVVVFLSDNGGCAEEIGPEGRGGGVPLETRSGEPMRLGNDPSIAPGPEDTFASYGLEWAGASNTPFRRFKSFVHEGGIATPLIVSWPGRLAHAVTHEQGHIIDLMPTFLALAGAEAPTRFNGQPVQPLEGRSLLPLLDGGTRPEVMYGWEHEGNRAVRQGSWKLVSRFPQAWELYDMRTDRLETRDLASEMPARVAELSRLYDEWAVRVGVKPWTGAQTEIGWPDLSRYR